MFTSSATLLLLGLLATVQAKVQFLGVGIAGGDFGCTIDGTCVTGSVQLPLSSLGGGDGQGQMQHFVQNDGVNIFRLPVGWQFLANNKLEGALDATNLGKYDQVMQACLATGAHCMIDIHNFARWNGAVIGQGGPADDAFVSLWSQLATKYAAEPKIVFELMNEPHELDVPLWAQTCQKAVTAIREAGATTQMILLPGTNFDSAATLVSSGSADALMAIRNPDGTADNLLLDIHKYLDSDNSGQHEQCTTDNVDSFSILADYLRAAGRQGFISETGASTDASCISAMCAQNEFINKNADVFVGIVGWGAGSFSTDYVMSLTPSKNGNAFVDNALMTQCFVDTWLQSPSTPAQTTPAAVASPAPATPAPATPTPAAPSAPSSTPTIGVPTTFTTATSSSSSSSSSSSTTSDAPAPSTPASDDTIPTPTGGMSNEITLTVPLRDSQPTVLMGENTLVLATAVTMGFGAKSAGADDDTLLVAQGTPTHTGYFGMPVAPTNAPGTTFMGGTGTGTGSSSGSSASDSTAAKSSNSPTQLVSGALRTHVSVGGGALAAVAAAAVLLL